jgi:hypothetical protein
MQLILITFSFLTLIFAVTGIWSGKNPFMMAFGFICLIFNSLPLLLFVITLIVVVTGLPYALYHGLANMFQTEGFSQTFWTGWFFASILSLFVPKLRYFMWSIWLVMICITQHNYMVTASDFGHLCWWAFVVIASALFIMAFKDN